MNISNAKINCHYCLSEIPAQALVCRYCGRSVNELPPGKLEDAVSDGMKNPQVPLKQHIARALVWGFYMIPAVILLNPTGDIFQRLAESASSIFHIDVSLVAALMLGFIIAALGWVRNVWLAFFIGALEPIILLFVAMIKAGGDKNLILDRLKGWPQDAIVIGSLCAIGCLLALIIISFISKRRLSLRIFNPEPFFRLLDPAESPVARFEQRVVKLIGMASGFLLILQTILNGIRKEP